MSMDLVEFLRARLAEDAAEAEKQPDFEEIGWQGYEIEASGATGYPCEKFLRIAKARVLREVDAKQRILSLHSVRHGTGGDWDTDPPALCNECGDLSPCPTRRLLAAPYADHPDYREEWRP